MANSDGMPMKISTIFFKSMQFPDSGDRFIAQGWNHAKALGATQTDAPDGKTVLSITDAPPAAASAATTSSGDKVEAPPLKKARSGDDVESTDVGVAVSEGLAEI